MSILENQGITVKDIMTTAVVSVTPNTSLVDASRVLAEHHFDGVPVVDSENRLLGILTEYDLVSKGTATHLPTLQTVLENLKVFRKDKSRFQKEVAELSALTVKDVMNDDPLTLTEEATYEDAVKAFHDHHRVNPIPVIGKEKKVIGVISRFDILKPLHLLVG